MTEAGDPMSRSWPSRWPFADEQAFWRWAMDSDAELCDQDEDILLHDSDGLELLVAAADLPACPKHQYCCRILEDFALMIVNRELPGEREALHAAAAYAAGGTQPHTRRWGGLRRTALFNYVDQPQGPVNRSKAEQMAADLLFGPNLQQRAATGRPPGSVDRAGHAQWQSLALRRA
jgi:hypothetical protein